MSFDITQAIIGAIIGLIVGALACYLGWQGLNVWLKESPVESGVLGFLTKSEIGDIMKAIAAIICGIAVLSGIWLIILVLLGWKVWIDTPLATIPILLGWRLCQKNPDKTLRVVIGVIAATLGSFMLIMAITMTFFRIFFWRLVFGF